MSDSNQARRLNLSRKTGDRIRIRDEHGRDVILTFRFINNKRLSVKCEAPRSFDIKRGELVGLPPENTEFYVEDGR